MKYMFPLVLLLVAIDAQDVSSIFFRLYHKRENSTDYTDRLIQNATELFSLPWYNSSKPSVFYFHGFLDSVDTESVILPVTALLNRVDFNVFAVDWRKLSYASTGLQRYINIALYFQSASNTKLVGEACADVINDVIGQGRINASQVYLMGFSFGAQISGFIARNMITKPPAIIGLDPAGPGFRKNNPERLTAKDADTVQIVHTDQGFIGTTLSEGHANFFFNDGTRSQPGCGTLFQIEIDCSHGRAWLFMTEAIERAKQAIAKQCNDYAEFRSNTCNGTLFYLTFPPDTSATGNLHLSTNSKPPFLRGMNGTRV